MIDPSVKDPPVLRLPRWARLILGGALLVLVLIAAFYLLRFHGPLSIDQEHWGQFGDYFGGVLNPIFGFMSFLALLYALVIQSDTLQLSRTELRLSTEQLARSAKALDQQYQVLSRQSFENTFFQLLRNFSQILAEVRLGTRSGRQAIELLFLQAKSNIANQRNRDGTAQQGYEQFYRGNSQYTAHYFRTLFHVFKFIDQSTLSTEDKIVYANIARAQLSDPELGLLFYNGITGEGAEGFKALIERYGLLKHVKAGQLNLAEDRDNREFYSERAFLSADERELFDARQGAQ